MILKEKVNNVFIDILFSIARLFSKHDVNIRNAYPLYTQIKPSKRIFCMVCHVYTAT